MTQPSNVIGPDDDESPRTGFAAMRHRDFLHFAPAIGFALFTGYVADRYERRIVIALCSALIMIASILFWVISLAGMDQSLPILMVLLVLGTGRAFYQPASNSFVPNLVPKIELPNAIAWYTSANKICQTVGPALGGVGYRMSGPEAVYMGAAFHLVLERSVSY